MSLKELLSELDCDFEQNASLDLYSGFRVGGPADWLVFPKHEHALQRIIQYLKAEALPLFMMGSAYNLVIADQGIRGVVLSLTRYCQDITFEGDEIVADAGVSLAGLSSFAARNGLSGLEFASGIPGTVGGGIMMNCGAYNHSMSDVVVKTKFLDQDCNYQFLNGEQHDFSYRQSYFTRHEGIISKAYFRLQKKAKQEIYNEMAEFSYKRRLSQPLDKACAGSAFKRPPGYFAGKLIGDAGLKGFRIGDAGVSEKHAGFIVNYGKATALEVFQVFRHVQTCVSDRFQILLEPEVKFVGEWTEEQVQQLGLKR